MTTDRNPDPPGDASAKPAPADAARPIRPKDAATLILVDRSDGAARVLMGRRRDDLVFMPGKYVFPGGSVDPADRVLAQSYALAESETAKLLIEMKGEVGEVRATALALAAIRETFEEAGLVIGSPLGKAAEARADAWRTFFELGFGPNLGAVRFFARAITPPGRPRRFDTRFFWADVSTVTHREASGDGELSGLHWLTIEEARALDVPTITRVVLDDLMDRMDAREEPAVPFYHQKNGSFRRDLLRAPFDVGSA